MKQITLLHTFNQMSNMNDPAVQRSTPIHADMSLDNSDLVFENSF